MHPGAITALLSGLGRVLSLRLAVHYECATSFNIDASKIALQLSSVDVPSRRSTIVPVETGMLAAKRLTTGMLSWVPGAYGLDLSFRLPPRLEPDMYAATIVSSYPDVAQPYPAQVYVPSAAHGDPGLQQTLGTFLNRVVYSRGGLYLHCEAASGVVIDIGPDQPLRIISAARSNEESAIWTLGGSRNTLDNSALFLALDPLLVRFASARIHVEAASASGRSASPSAVMHDSTKCGVFRATVSDFWEAQRIFSFRHPYDWPEWPVKFRSALRAGKILQGMTHEMVAGVLGYPSTYAPIPKLDRLARWDYSASAPFSFSVLFRGDRVSKYNPPGKLP